jgi:hypothetical protein
MLAQSSFHRASSSEYPSTSVAEPVRKRKTFSCYACRRKKLRCDKLTPCSRCSKSGSNCVYDSRPADSYDYVVRSASRPANVDNFNKPQPMANFSNGIGSHGNFDMPFAGGDIILPGTEMPGMHHPIGDAAQNNSPVLESLMALVQKQAAHIAFLEEEYNQREVRDRTINGSSFSPQSATEPNPFMNNEHNNFGPSPLMSDMVQVPKDEVLLFAGKGFKTFYLGASNPRSIVSNSPKILQNVS